MSYKRKQIVKNINLAISMVFKNNGMYRLLPINFVHAFIFAMPFKYYAILNFLTKYLDEINYPLRENIIRIIIEIL